MLKGSGRLQGTLPLKNSPFLTATVLAISAKYCFPQGLAMFFTKSGVLRGPQSTSPPATESTRRYWKCWFDSSPSAAECLFLKITPTKHNGFEKKT